MDRRRNRNTNISRLSELPNHVLLKIIDLLPFREERIKIYTLSKRFHRLIYLAKIVQIDDGLVPDQQSIRDGVGFIDRFFDYQNNEAIDDFTVIFSRDHGDEELLKRVGEIWVRRALLRSVKFLYLHIDTTAQTQNNFFLPRSLFESTSLEVLVLEFVREAGNIVIQVPNRVSLTTLRHLKISGIRFEDGESLERLLTGCTVLQQLSMINCDLATQEIFRISQTSVETLEIAVNSRRNYEVNLPALLKVYILLTVPAQHMDDNYGVNFLRLFEHARTVRLEADGIPQLTNGFLGGTDEPVPVQLNWVELILVPTDHMDYTTYRWISLFLHFLPKLSRLDLNLEGLLLPDEFSGSQSLPPCLASGLQEVEIYTNISGQPVRTIVDYFLMNGAVLRSFIISTPDAAVKTELTAQVGFMKALMVSGECEIKVKLAGGGVYRRRSP
ncbi:F-box/LRR-repeat protein [Corchorus capsularis]|uniref:F-box/LRR-repeat protein n=1 Tax=Corchorus capsularis TaxID=210143 RepID=A0A1R3I239_COCAP|nr:F-box/LRR-repeat protein [Corchorus capsularis]